MYSQEIKDFVNSLHNGKKYNVNATRANSSIYKTNKSKFDKIIKLTSFLNKDVKWSERYFNILNNITSYSKCKHPECNNDITRFIAETPHRYATYCSNKCRNTSPFKNKDIKNTYKNKAIANSKKYDEIKSSNHTLTELKNLIKDNFYLKDGRLNGNVFSTHTELFLKHMKELKQIEELTSFLSYEITFSKRIYCLLNDINTEPLCKQCLSNKLAFGTNEISFSFRPFCSVKCSANDIDISKKKVETNKRLYGEDVYKNKALQYHQNKTDDNRQRDIDNSIITKTKNGTLQNSLDIIEKSHQSKLSRIDENDNNSYDRAKIEVINTALKKSNGKYTNFLQFPENIEKIKQTMLKIDSSGDSGYKRANRKSILFYQHNFGVNTYSQTEEYKAKVHTIIYTKYRKRYIDNSISVKTSLEEYVINRLNLFNMNVLLECNECNHTYYANLHYNGTIAICRECNPFVQSKEELKIYEFMSSYVECEHSNRSTIKSDYSNRYLEIDVLADDFGIEYDGLQFHSFGKSKHSMFNTYETESEGYIKHLRKTELCEEQNIQLFHIFENEWLDSTKQDIWKSMLLSKLGKSTRIFARKCKVKEVETKEAKEFFELNHLQGYTNAKVKLGLYYEDELVSCMTFGKSRYNKNIEWELIRFSSTMNHNIIGGASRLLKAFERLYIPTSLISYANRRWSQGNVYEKLGFEFKENTKPNYFYFHEQIGILESRQKFQKHKLKDLLKDFDSSLTETENMYNNHYRKIYDCGNKVYIKHYN